MTEFLATVGVFIVIDGVWLGLVARTFYRRHLGYLMAEKPNWAAAGVFYLLYAIGLTVFAVIPGTDAASALEGLWRGALFGLVAYATYDLTNQATVRDWPAIVTGVDLAWGTILSASVAGIATYAVMTFF
ncbi:MAG: DUF2177 family protein [Chloroflexota bacterium]|nr:DUF2177 family protein [Chloroflexota bacterium]